jgi:2'-5' RNA ligase
MEHGMRLFIALCMPEMVRNPLAQWQKQWPARFFKPLKPDNLHMTLVFLGDAEPEVIPFLQNTLNQVVEGFETFSCILEGIGAFPNPWEPRVVWAGITTGGLEATRISDALRTLLKGGNVRFDPKPFRPHITLAYAKKSLNRTELKEAGSDFSDLVKRFGIGQGEKVLFQASEISLMQSDLKPEGAIHTPLYSVHLL